MYPTSARTNGYERRSTVYVSAEKYERKYRATAEKITNPVTT
jgi:hypothetical protein